MSVISARERILVVDDEPHYAELLRSLLALDGYAVEAVHDGETALRHIAVASPDVILLDVGLPGISGVQVCRVIKQMASTRLIPVILVTGSCGRNDRLAGINAGADEILSKPFDRDQLLARVRALARLKRYTDEFETAQSIIMSLALTIEARDAYTEGHCERLASHAVQLGTALGLGDDDLLALRRGGFLHDVGKIGIPDSVLLKDEPLTAEEFAIIKQHPEIGERLLGNLRSLAPVRPIVRHHHERLDGSGYPDGLGGSEIPLLAHIVAVVDAYDAMTTARPYRVAMSADRAIDELRRDVVRGKMSRDLVEMFIAVLNGRMLDKIA